MHKYMYIVYIYEKALRINGTNESIVSVSCVRLLHMRIENEMERVWTDKDLKNHIKLVIIDKLKGLRKIRTRSEEKKDENWKKKNVGLNVVSNGSDMYPARIC